MRNSLLWPCLSGVIFLLVFQAGYGIYPNRYYQNRDDALITFSHARNLAEYGIVGVNPSGGRVEGFSSPLQFIVFFTAYEAFRVSYAVYSKWQTIICTFFLGFIFIRFFQPLGLWGLIFSFGAAVLCTRDPSFLGWHGSGMENPLVHVMLLASVYGLLSMFRRRKLSAFFGILLFLASIARTETIYYLGPLLVFFAFIWNRAEKNNMGSRFAAVVFAFWGIFQFSRFLFFGDVMSNPAHAQNIHVLNRIRSLFALDPAALGSSLRAAASIAAAHYGVLVILALPLLFFVRKDKEIRLVLGLAALILILACFNPFVFGPSELDLTRTTTLMTIFAALFVFFQIFHLKQKKRRPFVGVIFILLAFTLTEAWGKKPYRLNWDSEDFRFFRAQIVRVQQIHALVRPTIANADLGLISWHKDFNIVDLGRLGDPVLSRLDKPREITDYFFIFAVPDILEIHGAWIDRYRFLFNDPRFQTLYLPVRDDEVKTGLWMRKDICIGSDSRERRLLDKLKSGLSISTVREELADCAAAVPVRSSLYVTRSVYRYLPEFTRRGELAALASLFQKTPSSAYDLAVINGGHRADGYREIIAAVREWGRRSLRDLIQKSGRIEMKKYPDKKGFHKDGIWTQNEAELRNLEYQVPPGKNFLVIRTYGIRSSLKSGRDVFRPRSFIDGKECPFVRANPREFIFRIPSSIKAVNRIRILSSTFVPKKIGLGEDQRKLGMDVKALEFR